MVVLEQLGDRLNYISNSLVMRLLLILFYNIRKNSLKNFIKKVCK